MLYEAPPSVSQPNGDPTIKLATSDDGISWTKSSTDLVGSGPADWENGCMNSSCLLKLNGVYYCTYEGGGSGNWKAGMAQSTDMIHWTRYSGNPITSESGVNGNAVLSTDVVDTPSQYLMYAWNYKTLGGGYNVYSSPKSLPEPIAIVLMATGLIGVLAYAWRQRR